jgi:ribA/ribD-fused uncharacterized protein
MYAVCAYAQTIPAVRRGVEVAESFIDPTRLIDQFRGEHEFLSNFSPDPVELEGVVYPTAEHAFNALKTVDPAQLGRVLHAPTPSKAKYEGRRVTLRPGLDESVRFEAMAAVISAKFATAVAADRLLATGDALLVEGTTWCDQTWGQCSCTKHRAWPGANHLGRTLMRERASLRGDRPDHFPRAAVTGGPGCSTAAHALGAVRTLAPTIARGLLGPGRDDWGHQDEWPQVRRSPRGRVVGPVGIAPRGRHDPPPRRR